MSGYTQLTRGQRYQIQALMKAGHNQTEIATVVGVHKSTISREVRRNHGLRGYRPKQAHRLALARRVNKAQSRIGQQTGPATVYTAEQQIKYAGLIERVQVTGGLVREDQLWPGQQYSADRHALALALRKVVGETLEFVAYS